MKTMAFINSVIALSILLAASAAAQDKIGVAICDEYLAKAETCNARLVPANRAKANQIIEASRKEWKGLAVDPRTKPALEGICKEAMERAKASIPQ